MGGGGIYHGEFAPLLSTAMETLDLDFGLESRFVLLMSVGPDCHFRVLVASKLQFLLQFGPGLTQDAPRQVRCARKLSCRYTDSFRQDMVQYRHNM